MLAIITRNKNKTFAPNVRSSDNNGADVSHTLSMLHILYNHTSGKIHTTALYHDHCSVSENKSKGAQNSGSEWGRRIGEMVCVCVCVCGRRGGAQDWGLEADDNGTFVSAASTGERSCFVGNVVVEVPLYFRHLLDRLGPHRQR